MSQMNAVWRLRRGMDRRFRQGHPWVYSNELLESPKGLTPGGSVELQDAGGKFLALGYGNPKSLIAFRCLSRDVNLKNPMAMDPVVATLVRAGRLRIAVGLGDVSHRLCFGEADFLPGLVIDRYSLKDGQVFVVQAHTAGANFWMGSILEILERYVAALAAGQEIGKEVWKKTSVVLRNDLRVRVLEGLEEESPRVLKSVPGIELENVQIRVASVLAPFSQSVLNFNVNLISGQKTGFF